MKTLTAVVCSSLVFCAAVSVAYDLDIVEDLLACNVSVGAGYASEDWAIAYSGGTKGGLHDYRISASLTYLATDSVELGANVAYTDTLDEDVLPEQEVDIHGGASVSVSF